jgi:LuxR family transcriptional regulator, maltose regulon positive regulatory protein
VPRAFRHSPPTALGSILDRPRLRDRLDHRWARRLITIVAGPGFGKTTLLATALAAHDGPGRDIWLACEPSDESGTHLVRSLAEAGGLGDVMDVEGLSSAVWSRAPEPLCFVLDDVHEIPPRSDGAHALERLVTELPRNGHLVFASRDTMPVRTARLAAAGELDRITEAELLLDDGELDEFALARQVDRNLLDSTGGWPALAELTATTGADLVLDYLWEEVLAGLGADRTRRLAQLAVVGHADDEIASAIAGDAVRVDDLVAGVPLIQRSQDGVVSLHALWGPALRPHLDRDATAAARLAAAAVHRARAHHQQAVDLLVEAEAWDEIRAVVRDAELNLIVPTSATEVRRWCELLPPEWERAPEVLLATALSRRADEPVEALPLLAAARQAFAERGDADGEAAALAQEGLVRWWSHDIANLVALIERVHALAEAGSEMARALSAIGAAAVAHLGGDSAGVRSHLDEIAGRVPGGWLGTVHWLRSVAYRRDGDLAAARRELDAAPMFAATGYRLELESAGLRTAWLEGEVDEAHAGWTAHCHEYEALRDSYTAREVVLELARVEAWLGNAGACRDLLAACQDLTTMETPLARILACMAETAAAVAEGDEQSAAARVSDEVTAALGGPEAWYWRDRATIALTHVLVPASREAWAREPLGAAHRPGLDLAVALEAARAGDLAPVLALDWPSPGVVRAHLPVRWVAELIAAAAAAKAPAPSELVRTMEADLRDALVDLEAAHPDPRVAKAAGRLAAELPPRPRGSVRIEVLGPLVVWRDGVRVDQPELQRRRVRELLCSMVAHREVWREALADDLWPDHPDPRQNLRVNLAYLQRVLQPDRQPGEAPYFLRADSIHLRLGGDQLEVDAWTLEALLDEGDAADRAGAPAAALDAYQSAGELWRGEPYEHGPDVAWVERERTRLKSRFVASMLRAGELQLATGDFDGALDAGRRAVLADPWAESAHRLIIRTHLARDDRPAAEQALAACRSTLSDLGVEPADETERLLA